MTTIPDAKACFHACQAGCGRTYDLIIVMVIDGSTLFYCIPCSVAFLHQTVTAMVEPDDPAIQEVMAGTDISEVAYVSEDASDYMKLSPTEREDPDGFDFDGVDED